MLHVIRKFSVYNGKWGKKSTLCSLILFCYTLCAFVFVVWIFCLVSLGYTCGHTSPVSQGEAPSHCAWKFLSLSQWFPSCETLKAPLFHLLRISDALTALCRQPGRIWLAQHGLRLPLPALGLGGSGRPPPPGALLSPLVRAWLSWFWEEGVSPHVLCAQWPGSQSFSFLVYPCTRFPQTALGASGTAAVEGFRVGLVLREITSPPHREFTSPGSCMRPVELIRDVWKQVNLRRSCWGSWFLSS